MTPLDDKYFAKFSYTPSQIRNNLYNALKDLDIAERDKIFDVKFNYSYTALLKAGLALLSQCGLKPKSTPGHHVYIIEFLAQKLGDPAINDLGEAMRRKRNIGLYAGGVEITAKECQEYLIFVRNVIARVKDLIKS